MQVNKAEQGSDEWLQARLGKFTASRAGDLMKKQRNGTPYATRKNYITELALERLTGKAKEVVQTEAMLNGVESERVAALAYSFAKNVETEQTGFWHNDIYGASPDDLVGDDGGVEYKNPMPATHYETLKSQEIPEHYYWQIVQCLLVTGRSWWDYVSHCSDFDHNAQLFVKRVHKKEVLADIKALEAEIKIANKEVEEQVNFIKNYKEKL
jgi:predicted phage-related endonuclease